MSFKPRYILAEEAEERIVALYRKERGDAAKIFNTAIDACQNIILDMYDNSSKDVVPVVRCKDCKHWGMHKSLNVPWCFKMHTDKSEDGYCDSGERS